MVKTIFCSESLSKFKPINQTNQKLPLLKTLSFFFLIFEMSRALKLSSNTLKGWKYARIAN